MAGRARPHPGVARAVDRRARWQAIGFIQIIDPHLEDSHYWGESAANLRAIDIWIGEACDLSRGYGTQMMRMALDICFSHPDVTAVIIDPLESNLGARRFYERLGFRFTGNRTFGLDHCAVYELDRAAWYACGSTGLSPS